MTERDRIVNHLQILRTWAAVNPKFGQGLNEEECGKAVEWIDAALELLNKQDDLLKALSQVNRVNDYLNKQLAERPQIVRCKDCGASRASDGYCTRHHIAEQGPDFFCADGYT